MYMLTGKQRENLAKITINAINLDLGTFLARYFMGEPNRLTLVFTCGSVEILKM